MLQFFILGPKKLNRILELGSVFARAVAYACLAPILIAQGFAASDKAAIFYEDALKRYERNDLEGSIVQLKNAVKEDQRLLAAHLLLGKALVRSSDFNGAEVAFKEALKQGVNLGEVAIPLGRIYIAMGNPEKAIELIPSTGLTRNLQVEVLSMRGTAYHEAGNPRLAAQSFEQARALDPSSPVPYIEEVPTLLQAGMKAKARASAAKAIQLAPNNADAWNMQASVLHEAMDIQSALSAYSRAISLNESHLDARIARAGIFLDLKRDAEAEKELKYLLEVSPEEPRSAYLRAMLASRKGDAQGAARALGEAAHVIDALPPTWLQRREQLMMLAALAHHGLGNLQKAREYLEIIVTRYAGNVAARKLLASIYVQVRDYQRATPILESLQKVSPDDPQVMFQVGLSYFGQKRFALAVSAFEKASVRMDTPELKRSLALSLLGMGSEEQAMGLLGKLVATSPGDFESGTTLATLLMRRGEHAKALKIAEGMLKQSPGNPAAHNFLGTVKASSGDNAGARAAFNQALAKRPEYLPAVLNLVKLDVSAGSFDAGRQRLTSLLIKRPDDVDILYELGMLEERANRNSEAVRHLAKANESKRRDTRAGLALVNLHLRAARADAALVVAKGMASKYANDLGVQLALGRAHMAAGDSSSARSIYANATRLAGFDSDIQVAIGRLQIEAGNPDGAAYNTQKALQDDRAHLPAMVLAVEIESQRKDYAKAQAALRELTSKYPNRVETALSAATLAMARGQYPDAVAAYRVALSRQDSTSTAIGLAYAHIAAGELPKAASFLDGWVKSKPGDQLALKSLAEVQFRAGQLNVARQTYSKALAIEPNDAVMLNNYANLLFKLGDAGAKAAAEQAVKLAPDNPRYADTLGWILVNQGEINNGLRYLREARLRSPGDADIRFHLAFALSKAGRAEEAKSELLAAMNGQQKLDNPAEADKLRRELGI